MAVYTTLIHVRASGRHHAGCRRKRGHVTLDFAVMVVPAWWVCKRSRARRRLALAVTAVGGGRRALATTRVCPGNRKRGQATFDFRMIVAA